LVNLFINYILLSVAAPDHKIRQCNQRSTLFPGMADGRTEGLERGAGSRRKAPESRRGVGP